MQMGAVDFVQKPLTVEKIKDRNIWMHVVRKVSCHALCFAALLQAMSVASPGRFCNFVRCKIALQLDLVHLASRLNASEGPELVSIVPITGKCKGFLLGGSVQKRCSWHYHSSSFDVSQAWSRHTTRPGPNKQLESVSLLLDNLVAFCP